MFIWDFVAAKVLGQIVDWFYSQIVGFLGNFFSEMGNMGAELFTMDWVQSIVLFFSYLAWALYGTGLVVACFETGVEYSSGRGNIRETALNAIKGFMAVSLFTVVPVRLYEPCVSLQGTFTAALTGYGTSTPFLDRMLVLDYIIANEDRHFNNFGALRNAETLEWLGMAPIYDSGSSLGYDKMPGQMRSEKDVVCKPFKNHHAEQLKLVTDFDWIDFDRLSDVDELISSVLSCEEAADYIDEGRIHAITESVQRRIGHLQELAMTQTPRQLDTTEDDVREEVAADHAPKMEL